MPVRISLQWLREYIELPEEPAQLAEALTLAGTEVERVIELGAGWDGLVVARVRQAELIPGSDHLRRAVLEVGGKEVQVVSGAPNFQVGDLVPLALPGTTLPSGLRVDERRFMGVVSAAMMLSPLELGLSSDHEGIMLLGTGGESGQDLNELMPRDHVLVVEPTTNRPDLFCHLGIAREFSAIFNRPLNQPQARPAESEDGAPRIEVEIQDPDLCARYVARCIDGISPGPSPEWMERRLRAVGQRPINNVVDAANYVLLEMGQPLHTFDAARLRSVDRAGIVIRRALEGESLLCLDGKQRALKHGMLVIADREGAVAIAGIIGGSDSGVGPSTTRVVIESANFQGVSVRSTSRRLGLRTEASARFEKQLHPDLAPPAAARLAQLLQQVAGAGAAGAPVDVYPAPYVSPTIRIEPKFFGTTLGEALGAEEIGSSLRRLFFRVELNGDRLDVTPPDFRLDVQIPVDLVEELGRLRGYNALLGTLPGRRIEVDRLLPPPDPEWRARDIALGAGYDEVVAMSFASDDDPEMGAFPQAPRLRLENPMAAEFASLRVSLLPGLLRTVRDNAAVGNRDLRLFELGRVFWPAPAGLPVEHRILGLAVALAAEHDAARSALLAVKGFLEELAENLSEAAISFEQGAVSGLHPGRGAQVSAAGNVIGCLGEVHPEVLRRYDLSSPVMVAELDFEALVASLRHPRYTPLPRFPAVSWDLAVTVPLGIGAGVVLAAIGEGENAILRDVELFDEYIGDQVEAGRKSLAFHLVFQTAERTLTTAEVHQAIERVAERLRERFGARVRD